MPDHNLLGQLSGLHQMTVQLVENTPEEACYHSHHPALAPIAWYLGRAVYLETHWLRDVVQGDREMTTLVREIFTPGLLPADDQYRHLPPKDHLLNWALELLDENLMRLANPGQLPRHPLLEDERLLHLILQSWSELYERMLQVLTERRWQAGEEYQVLSPLSSGQPVERHTGISQGHYRIGAKGDPAAFDNEQPAQIVNLSSFRIDPEPVSNANYLAFMEADGYLREEFWSTEGWQWNLENNTPNPHLWRQDPGGNWYATGLNGPFDLIGGEPVTGITHHEATAYANWVSSLGNGLEGAVLQHEYQWEVAARTQALKGFGRVWEWCANLFTPYTDYLPSEYAEARTGDFDDRHYTLRGASLHTQRPLRRASYRNHAPADSNCLFAGARLVYPPR